MFLAISIILTLLVALFLYSAHQTKLPIRHRVLHIRYLLVTLAFAIAGVALFAKILQIINKILSLPILQRLMLAVIPPSNVAAGFYWIITLVCCLLLALLYWLVMSLIKAIWLKPLSHRAYLQVKFWPEKLLNAIAGLFYEIHDDRANLPPRKANVGRWMATMRNIFATLLLAESLFVALYLHFDWNFLGENGLTLFVKSAFMLPVMSYIILDQIALFFAADPEKGEPMLDTEEIHTGIQGNFDALVELYKQLFGGHSLISNYVGNGKEGVQKELFSGLQAEQLERVENKELLEAIARSVQCATPITGHYANGLVDLVNGLDVAVFDSMWSEFDAYYLAYLQYLLHKGCSALVICDTQHQSEIMQERIKEMYRKINVVDPIWRIRNTETMADEDADILVCTEEQLLEEELESRYPNFCERLSMVIVLDTYGLLCREDSSFSRLFDFLARKPLQFVFYLPENNTDIRDELKSRMPGRTISLCESSNVNNKTNILFWRSESSYKPQTVISPRLYHDFGVAYTMAIIAARHDVPVIHVLAPDNVPTETYYGLVTSEYAKVLMEDYIKSSAINLSTVIRNNRCLFPSDSTLAFHIVYDEQNNLLNVAKTWLAYSGSDCSMLNIVSAPYMLRDYFAANMDTLAVGTTGLQLIVPRDPLNLRAPALSLLLRMRRGVTCEELMQFAKTFLPQEEQAESIIALMLESVLGKNHGYDLYNCFTFMEGNHPIFTNDCFIYTETIMLVNEQLYDILCSKTADFVRLEGDHKELLAISKKDVYNRFLPQQCVAFGGVRYIIDGISDGVITLRTEETVEMEDRYTPLYTITEFERQRNYGGSAVSNDRLTTDFFEVRLSREIRSYYAHPGMLRFKDDIDATLVELDTPITETKTVPCLHIELHCPLDECADKVANTLCHLINGAMATFLPNNYQDILVFSPVDKEAVRKGVSFCAENASDLLADPIPSDLLTGFEAAEDIHPDICRLVPNVAVELPESNTADTIHLYIAHFSETDIGLLNAVAADLPRILNTVRAYLQWVEGQSGTATDYMRFGYQQTPGIFDPVATLVCLSHLLPQIPNEEVSVADQEAKITGNDCCSFCGRPVSVVSYPMGDGRVMCAECHSHITTERKEIKTLLGQARELLEKHYGITLPDKIRVKFKSATAIRKECGNTTGRVLGFYNFKRREIWIERGGPEPCVLSTLTHELTHAWQHANLPPNAFLPKNLKYIEGHSSYVEVECLRVLGQNVYADFSERQLLSRDDEYGQGFRFWKECLRIEPDKNIFHHIAGMF